MNTRARIEEHEASHAASRGEYGLAIVGFAAAAETYRRMGQVRDCRRCLDVLAAVARAWAAAVESPGEPMEHRIRT